MRRLLTVAAAAAAISTTCLAAAQPAAASGCLINLGTCLVVTFPSGPLNFGSVNAATSTISAEQAMSVAAGNTWGIKISSDQAGGKMKEWTGSAYVSSSPKIMHNALQWRVSSINGANQATSFANLSNTPSVALTNQPITGCVLVLLTCTDIPLGFKFKLNTSFSDANAGANDYRIQVTYDVALGY